MGFGALSSGCLRLQTNVSWSLAPFRLCSALLSKEPRVRGSLSMATDWPGSAKTSGKLSDGMEGCCPSPYKQTLVLLFVVLFSSL